MKFKFKIQPYQTDAVEAAAGIFNGQPNYDKVTYIRDLGKIKKRYDIHGKEVDTGVQASFTRDDNDEYIDLADETGKRGLNAKSMYSSLSSRVKEA